MIFSPPPRPVGSNNLARWAQWAHDTIRSLHPSKTDDYTIDHNARGWTLGGFKSGRGGAGSNVQRMIVKSIEADWFTCLPYDSTGQHPTDAEFDELSEEGKRAALIKVAKPWELRFSPWDGEDIDGLHFSYADDEFDFARRKVTSVGGGPSEIQIVVRPWLIGEIILAVTNITGGTDQRDDGPLDDGNPPFTDLIWEDTNQAAHAWAQTDISDPIDSTL